MTLRNLLNFLGVEILVGTTGEVYVQILSTEPPSNVFVNMNMRRIAPGWVPVLEENLVRKECGYKIDEWKALDYKTKALEVALARVNKYIELYYSDAQNQAMEKGSR